MRFARTWCCWRATTAGWGASGATGSACSDAPVGSAHAEPTALLAEQDADAGERGTALPSRAAQRILLVAAAGVLPGQIRPRLPPQKSRFVSDLSKLQCCRRNS